MISSVQKTTWTSWGSFSWALANPAWVCPFECLEDVGFHSSLVCLGGSWVGCSNASIHLLRLPRAHNDVQHWASFPSFPLHTHDPAMESKGNPILVLKPLRLPESTQISSVGSEHVSVGVTDHPIAFTAGALGCLLEKRTPLVCRHESASSESKSKCSAC